jgi:hypothetical protein
MVVAMKDAEDKTFDNFARKQGMWGGGFPAKRAMAADKLQEQWNEDEWRRNNWRCGHGWLRGEQCEICNAPQPAQEPVAYVTGMSFGRFIVEPLNRAMVLPVGMALYSSPQEKT